MQKIVSLILSIFAVFSTIFFNYFTGSFEYNKTIPNNYPCVFVGGFLVYGPTSEVRDVFPAWGIGSCDLIKELNNLGYDCREASVGPFSSAWDRACELYAQLVGTTVDYGEAHSKEHNHERYGREYDTSLIDDWGQENENGKLNKVNLIGQSYGGTTINFLLTLLADGDSAERAETTDGSISPLFEGGKSEWVNSITTIASPNNGTTAVNVAEKIGLLNFTEYLTLYIPGFAERLDVCNVVDFQLEHFRLSPEEGEAPRDFLSRAVRSMINQYNNDNGLYDLSLDGARQLNERSTVQENVYYYTLPYSATTPDENGNHVVDEDAFFILKLIGNSMGKLKNNTYNSFEIGDEWLENDGLINTISEKNPFNQPYTDFDFGMQAQSGVWNVFPVARGNHGSMIGMGNSKQNVLDLFTKLLDLINTNG